MTTEEFYLALAQKTQQTGTAWRVRTSPYRDHAPIRTVSGCQDPLEFLAGPPHDLPWTLMAALDMSSESYWRLAQASDWTYGPLRPRLLQACGLES